MSRLYCRCCEKDKLEIQNNAVSLGMTVTELIIKRCKDLPVRDRGMERKIYQAMMELTTEMNYIGKNINQAVVAIHNLKFVDGQQNERLDKFNALFKEYLSKRDHISAVLENAVK